MELKRPSLFDRLRPARRKKRFVSKSGRKYDWHPDIPDFRDKTFHAERRLSEKLPVEVDLRPFAPPIFDQYTTGSCTANALTRLWGYHEMRQNRSPYEGPQEFDNDKFEPGSRLFLYANERKMIGTFQEDSGAFLRDGIKSLASDGLCREALWEYDEKNVFKEPSTACYLEAANHRISSYARIRSHRDMKACLALQIPFVFGFMVFESFEGKRVSRTGNMPIPSTKERDLGGHAICAVGFKDSDTYPNGEPLPAFNREGEPNGYLIIANSWGETWGDMESGDPHGPGHFYMPYAFSSDPNFCDDFWTFHF